MSVRNTKAQAQFDTSWRPRTAEPYPGTPKMSAADGYAPQMLSPAVENLVAQLTRLPGIGSRTAHRLAFHILQTSTQEA